MRRYSGVEVNDKYRPTSGDLSDEEASAWSPPVTYRRRRTWGFLPWLIGAIVLLALAAAAGFGTANLLAQMRAVPPPLTALPDPTPTLAPRPSATPTAQPTEAPTASPTEEPFPTDEPTPPTAGATPREHIVVSGESLSLIALEYGVAVDEILELNELENPNVIVPGQVLLIPPP
ncbi:hypothetical protein BH23CHL6_BH23CHL6_07540 [soil metagenome]